MVSIPDTPTVNRNFRPVLTPSQLQATVTPKQKHARIISRQSNPYGELGKAVDYQPTPKTPTESSESENESSSGDQEIIPFKARKAAKKSKEPTVSQVITDSYMVSDPDDYDIRYRQEKKELPKAV